MLQKQEYFNKFIQVQYKNENTDSFFSLDCEDLLLWAIVAISAVMSFLILYYYELVFEHVDKEIIQANTEALESIWETYDNAHFVDMLYVAQTATVNEGGLIESILVVLYFSHFVMWLLYVVSWYRLHKDYAEY